MTVRLNEAYQVDKANVKVTVRVGDGQKGYTVVYIGSEEKTAGSSIEHDLGPGEDLEGKELRVSTTVTDTNKSTNRTSVTYVLQGGPKKETFVLTYEVKKEKDQVDYYAKFRLL